jgi:valyl-tRNA synthetase
MDIAPGRPLSVLLQGASDADQELLARHRLYLKNLGRLDDIRVLADEESPPPSATALLGTMKILVPMAGLIDVAAEKRRLEKKRGRGSDDLQKIQRKLENKQFLSKAPEAVLTKERQRFTELEREISQIDAQLAKLDELI